MAAGRRKTEPVFLSLVDNNKYTGRYTEVWKYKLSNSNKTFEKSKIDSAAVKNSSLNLKLVIAQYLSDVPRVRYAKKSFKNFVTPKKIQAALQET